VSTVVAGPREIIMSYSREAGNTGEVSMSARMPGLS
jgi:hypothetical protein